LVTTEDFKIKDTSNDSFVSSEEVKKIFPPNKITKDYIQIVRLRPKLSDNLKEEEIALTAKLTPVTAGENGSFNVVYVCAFNNVLDKTKIAEEWDLKSKELTKSGMSSADIGLFKKNWELLDAKRFYIENAFNFNIKSIGIYKCTQLIKTACQILVKGFDAISSGSGYSIKDNETTMENSIDIVFDNVDYSIGKMLEYVFYTSYYVNSDVITYVSFYKTHPHNTDSTLRLSFNNPTEKQAVSQLLSSVCKSSAEIFNSIKTQF
jgi:DNA-directed RNA polymerase subunit L